MTEPSKMPGPKEALEYAHDVLEHVGENLQGSGLDAIDLEGPSRDAIELIKAAIPVAKLHEALWGFVFTPSGVDIDDYGYDMDQFWPKIIELRKEMEALKCNPQK